MEHGPMSSVGDKMSPNFGAPMKPVEWPALRHLLLNCPIPFVVITIPKELLGPSESPPKNRIPPNKR
eukprot:3065249-Amphidinium_carterae.1